MNKTCPEEYPITLIVNDKEIATFQLTKADLEDWAIGYLYSEGIIHSVDDLDHLTVKEDQGMIKAKITAGFDVDQFLEKQRNFTAGCGKGVTFFSMSDVKKFKKVRIQSRVPLSYLLRKRNQFAKSCEMYLESGGMHGACLIDSQGNLTVREDIGRHNAVDKAIGYAVRNRLKAEEFILLTTGRISYEMLAKAARFGFGIVGSRTAATKQAIQLANFLQIEVVGYLRGRMTMIYTTCDRVVDDLSDHQAIM
ncbi:formate dehydrogenase accessory sulfurtransferase FdhD [Ammoniphilus sp. YIM 78166]|uniref:formate dehydrogenase accessory sulfurtransferase FdhD n=1 Tax=Ammoniphilus sp. YIM 78166 TaxID=1644106 RepID=UPI00106F8D3E|nr:formate dehydrogenase accessory sulfurtransferase FdhD [Ammoniphilus sp. YIM 78166]